MKILIVKTSSLGDIIQTFPAISYLRQKFPDAIIDWVVETEYVECIHSHPWIQHAIAFPSREWRRMPFLKKIKKIFYLPKIIQKFTKDLRQHEYDLLFDFQANFKSALVTIIARAKKKIGFGKKSVVEKLNLLSTNIQIDVDLTEQIQQWYLGLVKKFFQDETPFILQKVELILKKTEQKALKRFLYHKKPRYMVACFSAWTNKQLYQKTLLKFLLKLSRCEKPYFYLMSYSTTELEIAKKWHQKLPNSKIVHGVSVALWQALMKEMDLVFTVDTSSLALCGTTSTPSFSFFGPTQSKVYMPLGSKRFAWQGSCPYGVQFIRRCPRFRRCPTKSCLNSASADELMLAYAKEVAHLKK